MYIYVYICNCHHMYMYQILSYIYVHRDVFDVGKGRATAIINTSEIAIINSMPACAPPSSSSEVAINAREASMTYRYMTVCSTRLDSTRV